MELKHRKAQSLLVGFIGGYLVDQGALTLNQLDEALKRQIETAMQGRPLPIDRVLLEMGFVNEEQLSRARSAQAEDRTVARKRIARKRESRKKPVAPKSAAKTKTKDGD